MGKDTPVLISPLPHNSPVISPHFFIAKPASFSWSAMHKISFCSPRHIKAPSRYADRSSREWRKLTSPLRLSLLKRAPQPVGSVSFHSTQTLTGLLKTLNLSGFINSLQTQQEGGGAFEFCLFLWNRGGIRVWTLGTFTFNFIPLLITQGHLRSMHPLYRIKTHIFQSSVRSW